MQSCIELSYSDIRNIILELDLYDLEQSGANVILTHVGRFFEAKFTLYGVVSDSERVFVNSIEGDEENPVLRCTVYDERCTVYDETSSSESMYPERISGKVSFFNYGPFEGKSATSRGIIEYGISGVYEKYRSLGEQFLNDTEKKLISESAYIFLVLYPESVRSFGSENLLKARRFIKDGTAFAAALDSYIKEDLGLPGRRNLRRLIKEAKRHYESGFDRDKYVVLCKEAVKGLPFYAEKEVLDKYAEIKSRISSVMKNAGYSGEYPCFEKSEKYVSFGADVFGNNLSFLFASFGIKGEKARKYVNDATGDDRCLVLPSNLETEEALSVYTNGIFAILEGKSPSKEFEELVLGNNSPSPLERSVGLLFSVLALCLGVITFLGKTSNVVPGIVTAEILLIYGLYMIFSKRKCHVMKKIK